MSVQLFPQQTFTVVRQLAHNPSESGTHYVQAVVRNAFTDEIVETLQLTHQGGYRYSKSFRVPADTSGLGFYISIVTSVYSDSGYTTKSEIWGDEENTYLVLDHTKTQGGGYRGYTGPDMSDIRRIFREEIAKLPETPAPVVNIPEPEKMRWDEVIGALAEIRQAIVPQEPTDLTPVLQAISRAEQAIISKEVTPEADLSPVLGKLDEIAQKTDSHKEELSGKSDEAYIKLGEMLMAIPKEVKDIMENVEFKVSGSLKTTEDAEEDDKEEEATNKVDISKMM